MKIVKNILCVLLSITLVMVMACSCYASAQQKTSGGYSATSTITERSRQWILERFERYQTVPQLLEAIDRFGCENFVYETVPYGIIQDFSLDEFIFENNLHGVCFDFSCFVKCVVLLWSEVHERTDVQSFVYDVYLRNGKGHSYNFIDEDGHTWFLCLTTNVTYTKKGQPSLGIDEVINQTKQEYMRSYQERMFNLH